MIPTCDIRDKINSDGTCTPCQDHYNPTEDRKDCEYAECKEGFMISINGECEKCPLYTEVSPDDKSCQTPKCSKEDSRM